MTTLQVFTTVGIVADTNTQDPQPAAASVTLDCTCHRPRVTISVQVDQDQPANWQVWMISPMYGSASRSGPIATSSSFAEAFDLALRSGLDVMRQRHAPLTIPPIMP